MAFVDIVWAWTTDLHWTFWFANTWAAVSWIASYLTLPRRPTRTTGVTMPDNRKPRPDPTSYEGRRAEQIRARIPDVTDDELELAARNVDAAAVALAARTGRSFHEIRQSLQTIRVPPPVTISPTGVTKA